MRTPNNSPSNKLPIAIVAERYALLSTHSWVSRQRISSKSPMAEKFKQGGVNIQSLHILDRRKVDDERRCPHYGSGCRLAGQGALSTPIPLQGLRQDLRRTDGHAAVEPAS